MSWIRKMSTDLMASCLFALAAVGLIFPGHIFAQPLPPIASFTELEPTGHIAIEILEMDQVGEMPTQLRVSIAEQTMMLQYTEGGYEWYEESNPKLSGFQKLPDLSKVLKWNIEQDEAGFFQAEMPISHFEGPEVAEFYKAAERQSGELGFGTKPWVEPTVSTFGYLDQETGDIQMSAIAPGGQVLNINASFADGNKALLADSGVPNKWIIVIPAALVLVILGIAVISCALLIISGPLLCATTCPWGVDSFSSSCVTLSVTCDCADKPGSCTAGNTSVSLMTLYETPITLSKSTFDLTRYEESGMMHEGSTMRYLMGEWAMVSVDTFTKADGPQVEVLSSSSDDFANAQVAEVTRDLALKASEIGVGDHGRVLLLALPPHEDNSRLIPLPDLKVADASVPAGVGEGKLLVRADFSEDRQLQDLQVLDDTFGGVSAELLEHVQQNLSFEYGSDKEHRAIAFAVIDVGDSLEISQVQTYLPKCCW